MNSRSLFKKSVLAATVAAGALSLAGCMTETAYAPATGYGQFREGYSERQVEPNRWIVTFSGNSYTARDTVERYLLFRAAQLTVQSGNDYFIMVDRNTDKHTETYVSQPFGPGPWGGWGPSWRYYGRGFGWRSWDPFWGDPFWDRQVDVNTVERYEASAEIITGRGPKPADNVRAFDAHRVIETLGPTIHTPDMRR